MKTKTYISIAAFLAAGTAFAEAATFSLDLSPSSISTSQNSSGITAANVYGYTISEGSNISAWVGTYENSSLSSQVLASDGTLTLQIGAAASNNSGGNFAGVKFTLDDDYSNIQTANLSFNYVLGSTWGGNYSSFSCKYLCTVYGFDSSGNATSIGSWTYTDATSLSTDSAPQSATIDLRLDADADYASYGLIFNSIDTSTLGGGAGLSLEFSEITVSGTAIPEPSSFGLLAGLGALALAGTRRRRRK